MPDWPMTPLSSGQVRPQAHRDEVLRTSLLQTPVHLAWRSSWGGRQTFHLTCPCSVTCTSCLKHGAEDRIQLNGNKTLQSISGVCRGLNSV